MPSLRSGDLLFFGPPERCTHVALHLGQGCYVHSSSSGHIVDAINASAMAPGSRGDVTEETRRPQAAP